ncbi:hypothetical protein JGS39_25945 [Streptomyces sp. P01-B04]|uniref:hypothetical protein n=1 Tax=Streptomyces poriferorum TaxID=2798799 RepID=UPI001C5F7E18|nr:hypothetical protein [Streptomyces poriferorum]MBW5252394.1 hypothetical protein [Streptomyces poriferorum]MBW5262805.1 hypothetical protein [Streptomyces poriferorum]
MADPSEFLVPDASEEIAAVALSAIREGERAGYAERLEAFAEQHRARLGKMVRGSGPGPAQHRRCPLVGQLRV